MNIAPCEARTSEAVLTDLFDALYALDHLDLPPTSRKTVQIISARRLSRQIEALCPRHFGHGERTATYALALADRIGFDRTTRHDLHLASLLHDIGLLTLPQELISSEGPLDGQTYALFQSHPRIGAELLQPFRFLQPAGVLIAHHHERWDGAGYPYGLKGPFTPLGSRILAIADVFDASLKHHKDRSTEDPSSTIRLLQITAGSQFDPVLLDEFCSLLRTCNAPGGSAMGVPLDVSTTFPIYEVTP